MSTKTPESTTIVRFPDCDPFHHLNNSRYIDYFINEREHHLIEHYNFNIYAYAQQKGVSWVVTQNQIAYFVPALLMEKIRIQSTILKWGESDILVEMQMWDDAKKRLKSVLWSQFTHYDLENKKRIPHAEELVTRFSQYENPLEKEVSFEERVAELKLINLSK